jgi:hypothetical protein
MIGALSQTRRKAYEQAASFASLSLAISRAHHQAAMTHAKASGTSTTPRYIQVL